MEEVISEADRQEEKLQVFPMKMSRINTGKFSILILMAQTLAFICIIFKFHDSPLPPVKKYQRTHMIILSTWRSGSSFTGQLFSQHPDVFYLMEPVWHVWSKMHQNSVNLLHMAARDLVRSVFLCDMSVFEAYLPPEKFSSSFFQWETSRALCSPPVCNLFKRSDIIPQNHCKLLCPKNPFNITEKACKSYSHIVLKEVRFFDLKVLYPLLRDPSLNVKILHLVRDPRGVFHSREKTTSALSFDTKIVLGDIESQNSDADYEMIKQICESQVEMYRTVMTSNFSRLRSHYHMVRYEDIADDPIENARQMYQFANLNFTPKLKTWVHNITHGKGQGMSFVINSRDARNVSRAWRDHLPFKTVYRIQNICKEALKVFGYRTLKTETEQKNLSVNILLPPPKLSTGTNAPLT
ncbi:carbohydrate sulfotransferase 4 isoform X1 [Xenopus laevis]|uniref:Sulfotransferase n=3 Tax=Xenopus laevis TaxID=8355 RepID=A0A8J1KLH6_XENLA|nr:carbohydrate sulfotransferase 4 isoform X1 [Xenopus laevis]